METPIVQGPIYNELDKDYWNVLVVWFATFCSAVLGVGVWLGYVWIKELVLNTAEWSV